jgi:hypothetical protein
MVQAPVDKFRPRTKREHIASMIAESFSDLQRIKLYSNCCKKYPLRIVLTAFSEAKAFPEVRIKKSRAALFFYLVKTYAHQVHQNSRN